MSNTKTLAKPSFLVAHATQMVRELLSRWKLDPSSLSGEDLEHNQAITIRLFGVNVRLRRSSLERLRSLNYSEKDLEYASWIVDVLTTWLQIVFPKLATKPSDVAASIIVFMDLNFDNSWVKLLKDSFNWIFCKCTEQEEPEDIRSWHERGFLLAGSYGRQIRCRLLRLRMKRTQDAILLNTLLQGVKKGLPEVSEGMVDTAVLGQKDRLTCMEETPPEVLGDLEKRLTELNLKKVGVRKPSHMYSVSTHASLERKRSEGGTWGELFDLLPDQDTQRAISQLSYSQMFGYVMSFKCLYKIEYSYIFGRHREIYYMADFDHKEAILEARQKTFSPELKSRIHNSIAIPIIEPLKVRMISKSSSYINGLYNELSEQIFDQLIRKFEFSNCKKELEESDVHQLYNNCVTFWGTTDLYALSGDFEASTDKIHMDITTLILPMLALDPISLRILEIALTEQIISASVGRGSKREQFSYDQCRGQLMGCRYSFPILCLFNYLLFVQSIIEYLEFKGISRRDFAGIVKIVGDDLLSFIPRDFFPFWDKRTSSGGLTKSLGKNYLSNKFCIFCSKLFVKKLIRLPEGICYQWLLVPYLNMGFPFAMKKGGELGGFNRKSDEEFSLAIMKLPGSFEDTWWYRLPKRMSDRFVDQIKIHRNDVRVSCLDDFSLGFCSYPKIEQRAKTKWSLRFRRRINLSTKKHNWPERYGIFGTFYDLSYQVEIFDYKKIWAFSKKRVGRNWTYTHTNSRAFMSSLQKVGNSFVSQEFLEDSYR